MLSGKRITCKKIGAILICITLVMIVPFSSFASYGESQRKVSDNGEIDEVEEAFHSSQEVMEEDKADPEMEEDEMDPETEGDEADPETERDEADQGEEVEAGSNESESSEHENSEVESSAAEELLVIQDYADFAEEDPFFAEESAVHINNENFPYAILESEGGKFVLEEDIVWTKSAGDSGYAALQVTEPTLLELGAFSIYTAKGSKLEISGPLELHGETDVFYAEGELILKNGVSLFAEGDSITAIHINSTEQLQLSGVEIAAVGDNVCGILIDKGTLKSRDSILRLTGERAVAVICNEKQAVYGDMDIEIYGHSVTGIHMAEASVFGLTGEINIEGDRSVGVYFEVGVIQDTEKFEKFSCIMRGDDNIALFSEGEFTWSFLILRMWGEDTTAIHAKGDVYLKYCDLWLEDGGVVVSSSGEVIFDTCCVVPHMENAESFQRNAFPVYEHDDETFPFKGFNLEKYGVWYPKGYDLEDITFPESLTFYLYDPQNPERETDVMEVPIDFWMIFDYNVYGLDRIEIWYFTEELIEDFNIGGLSGGVIPLRFYDPEGLFLSHVLVLEDTSLAIFFRGDLEGCQEIRFWVSDDEMKTWVDYIEEEKIRLYLSDEGDVPGGYFKSEDFSLEEYYFFKLEAARDGELIASEEFMFILDSTDFEIPRDGSDRDDQGEERPETGRRRRNNQGQKADSGQNAGLLAASDITEKAGEDEAGLISLVADEDKFDERTDQGGFLIGEPEGNRDEKPGDPDGQEQLDEERYKVEADAELTGLGAIGTTLPGTGNFNESGTSDAGNNNWEAGFDLPEAGSIVDGGVFGGNSSDGFLETDWEIAGTASGSVSSFIYRYGSAAGAAAVVICGVVFALYQRRKRV